MPDTDDTFTIRPPRCFIIGRIAALVISAVFPLSEPTNGMMHGRATGRSCASVRYDLWSQDSDARAAPRGDAPQHDPGPAGCAPDRAAARGRLVRERADGRRITI